MFNFKVQAICALSVMSFLGLVMGTMAGGEAPECKGEKVEMTEETIMNVMECLKEVEATSYKEIPEDKKPCFGKCIMMKKNLVDEAGAVHQENMMELVQSSSLPKEVADALIKKVEQCFTDNGPNLQIAEESCASFTPLLDCMHMAFADTCQAQES